MYVQFMNLFVQRLFDGGSALCQALFQKPELLQGPDMWASSHEVVEETEN